MTEQMPKVNPGFLTRAIARKREEVAARRALVPADELQDRAGRRPAARPWAMALRDDGTTVIAEFKRRSPSAGALAPGVDVVERARLYERRGAAAISVLTDAAFDGTLEDLEAVADATSVPVLRKDFVVEPYQIWESRAAGADAALVIVAAVGDEDLAALAATASDLGLGLLVEVHRLEEAERAAAISPEVVGVNARDLEALVVSFERGLATLAAVREAFGEEVVLVAESGIRGPDDVRRARAAGADAVLVGERLMRSGDPGALVEELVRAGRGSASAPASTTESP